MLDFLGLIFVGLAISTVLVRVSSRKGMKLELSWFSSLKIVLTRSFVALCLGFLVGKLFAWLLSLDVASSWVKSPYFVVPLLVSAFLSAFVVYQWIVSRVSGSTVSFSSVLKSVLIESFYFVLIVLCASFLVGALALLVSG